MRRVALACVVLLAAAGAALAITRFGRTAALAAGCALIAVSLPLMALARIQLGKSFSVAPKATALVSHGVYSRIPHPLFTFLDIAVLGLIMVLRQPWLVLPWLALVAIHAWAARREARVLERAFGDAYREYRANTWW